MISILSGSQIQTRHAVVDSWSLSLEAYPEKPSVHHDWSSTHLTNQAQTLLKVIHIVSHTLVGQHVLNVEEKNLCISHNSLTLLVHALWAMLASGAYYIY